MIIRTNEWKKLIKHISCKCECKFDGKKCNSNQIWNSNKWQCECKTTRKNVWNPATCSCENDTYAGSIIDESVIMYDEIIETTKSILTKTVPAKSIPTNFNQKRWSVKWKIYIFSLPFY